jgi:hypothetical protein
MFNHRKVMANTARAMVTTMPVITACSAKSDNIEILE